MPTIVESSPTNAELFTSATGHGSRVVASLEELKRSLADTPDEYAVVVGPAVDLEAAAALADVLRVTRPALSVVLVRRRVDTSVLSEALRSGMREVVEERDLTGLGEAVRRAQQVHRALSSAPSLSEQDLPSGRLVTIFSPKGGVGKTTLAVNLAVALSNRNARVCLVDLDLSFGDVAITLQLLPARTIADAAHLGELDFGLLEPLLTAHRRGFSTLVAPVQPDAKDSLSPAVVSRILNLLKTHFDYVVVDTSPVFDEHVLQAFDETDELVLIAALDVPTLKNVKIAAETLDLLNFPVAKRHLVLNRADAKVGLSADKVEATLGMKVAVMVPTSVDVASATNAGDPITASQPRHAVSQAVVALADRLSAGGPAAGPPAAAAPARRGLLRRAGR